MVIANSMVAPVRPDVGIGLRLPHLEEAVATRPDVGWLEVHPENILANPHARELVRDLARHYPLSLHSVGLSVGSVAGVDRGHLARVRALVDELRPGLVSCHLAWSTHGSEYLNDLLPLPYTEGTLTLVSTQMRLVQDALGCRVLIENPSSYVGFAHSTMVETDFLNTLAFRTGCGVLCDVSNVHVSGHNMGYDPVAYLDTLDPALVGELHLGGFVREDDAATPGGALLIDTHSCRVDVAAWTLYARAAHRFPSAPTLIEWDADIPSLATLLSEAHRATAILNATRPLCAHAVAR